MDRRSSALWLLQQVCHSSAGARPWSDPSRYRPANIFVCVSVRMMTFVKVLDFDRSNVSIVSRELTLDGMVTARPHMARNWLLRLTWTDADLYRSAAWPTTC